MRREWLVSAALFVVACAVFSRVLVADFVQWDDDISVVRNPQVHGLDAGRLQWMFTDASYAMRYKPLTWLAYALIHQCGGLRPLPYHLVSLLFHAGNAVLVFLIIRRLLAVSGAAAGRAGRLWGAVLPAGLGALLWAVNPLRVEVVGRITDLTYCLVAFFLMLSLWFYLCACQRAGQGASRSGWYALSVAAYALAMLAYPVAFGWGLVLLALDWYPLRRFEGGAPEGCGARLFRLAREKTPFFLLGGLVLMTLLARSNPSPMWAQPSDGRGLGGFASAMQAFYIWAYYLWKPWAPFHLSPVYTTLVQFNPCGWRFWLSAGIVVGMTILCLWNRKRWPWAAVCWIAYLTLLLAALGLTEHPHYSADRYDYLPGLVWAVILAAGLWSLRARPRLLAVMAVGLAGLALWWACLSFRQMGAWRDTVSLLEHIVRELGDDPRRCDLRRRLGSLYAAQGRVAAAVQQYQIALRLDPDPKTCQALAELFDRNGQANAALTNYLAWLRLSPDPFAHNRAAAQLLLLGHRSEAISHYQQALLLQPDFVPVMEKLAWLLATDPDPPNRNGAEAVRLAERACALSASQTPLGLQVLAAAYAEAGRFPEAMAAARRGCNLAEAAGDGSLAAKDRALLDRFEAGQAWRE